MQHLQRYSAAVATPQRCWNIRWYLADQWIAFRIDFSNFELFSSESFQIDSSRFDSIWMKMCEMHSRNYKQWANLLTKWHFARKSFGQRQMTGNAWRKLIDFGFCLFVCLLTEIAMKWISLNACWCVCVICKWRYKNYSGNSKFFKFLIPRSSDRRPHIPLDEIRFLNT